MVVVWLEIAGDRFFWLSDEQFARETLAGVNPYSIQVVKARVPQNIWFLLLVSYTLKCSLIICSHLIFIL